MTVVGIDPGKYGGIAVFEDGALAAAYKMPKLESDAAQLILRVCATAELVAIERVTGWIPGKCWNASRMFVMGWWMGGPLFAAYLAAGARVKKVMAFKWQRDLGVSAKGDKSVLAEFAKPLFVTARFNKQVADAALIAWWAWKFNENSSKKMCTTRPMDLRSNRSENLAIQNQNQTQKPNTPMSEDTKPKKAAKAAAPAKPAAKPQKPAIDKVAKPEKPHTPLDDNYILKRAAKAIAKVAAGDDAEKLKELKKSMSKCTKFSKLTEGLEPEAVLAGLEAFFSQFLKKPAKA